MSTKQSIIVILLFILYAHPVHAEDYRVQENLHFKSSLLKMEIGYSIVLPADYFTSGKSYPVIYFLHGLGDNEASWLEYGQVAQYMDHMVNEHVISPFICVMPQGFRSYYSNFYTGDFPYQDMFVRELVPFIDSNYRTIRTAGERGVVGYSMGGFGALILPLKYPDIFHVSIPLSASIRSDHQYATEEQKGWDQQWGQIFGAEHSTGDARITDYYKQNSPYHLIQSMKAEDLRKIAFFMENGDKENTLCRSNEELHMLMVDKDIPHVYRVRAGGHEFKFWCEAIPEAFRFADCAFHNKPYKEKDTLEDTMTTQSHLFWKEEATVSGRKLSIFYPENQTSVKRFYPTVYFVSSLTVENQKKLISLYQQDLQNELLAPIIFCFLQPDPDSLFLRNVIQYMEKNKSSRDGRRFRAVWSYQNGGANVLEQALTPDQFTACVFTDSNLQTKLTGLEQLIEDHESIKENIRWYIDTPSSGDSYLANGYLHINLREHGFIHEYRVRHFYKDDFSFLLSGFSPAISYVSKRFHN